MEESSEEREKEQDLRRDEEDHTSSQSLTYQLSVETLERPFPCYVTSSLIHDQYRQDQGEQEQIILEGMEPLSDT
jgi:hypothetical protein